MTRPITSSPDWNEIFRNVIGLETRRGFNNSAVVGGMDRFREWWRDEMETRAQSGGDAGFLLRQNYGDLPPAERQRWASLWLGLIGDSPLDPEPKRSFISPSFTAQETFTCPGKYRPGKCPTGQPPRPVRSRNRHWGALFPSHRPALRVPPAGQSVDDPVDRLRGINTKVSAAVEAAGRCHGTRSAVPVPAPPRRLFKRHEHR